MIENFIILSALFCIDILITQFLISSYYKILKVNSKIKNTCFCYALALNPSLKMLSYLIEIIGADVNLKPSDIAFAYRANKFKHLVFEKSLNEICCKIIFSYLQHYSYLQQMKSWKRQNT